MLIKRADWRLLCLTHISAEQTTVHLSLPPKKDITCRANFCCYKKNMLYQFSKESSYKKNFNFLVLLNHVWLDSCSGVTWEHLHLVILKFFNKFLIRQNSPKDLCVLLTIHPTVSFSKPQFFNEHLFDHLLWSTLQSVFTQTNKLYFEDLCKFFWHYIFDTKFRQYFLNSKAGSSYLLKFVWYCSRLVLRSPENCSWNF